MMWKPPDQIIVSTCPQGAVCSPRSLDLFMFGYLGLVILALVVVVLIDARREKKERARRRGLQ